MNNTLEGKIQKLSPELQQEVETMIDSLLRQKISNANGKFNFEWEGALKDLRDQFTSVELQHKALEWWANSVSR